MGQTVSTASSSASKLYSGVLRLVPRFASKLNRGYEILNNQEDNFLLQIHPQELHFPFELKKQISCSLQLSNKSDNNMAFKVKTTNPGKYFVMPNIGVVLPRSTRDITVTMQAQKEAPPDMQCKDTFIFQSIVANRKKYHSKNGSTTKNITPKMFIKESGYEVEECELRVVYVSPPQPPSPLREGYDKDLKASNEQIKQHDTSFQIHPKELQFPFELRKQISCSMQLSNMSNNYVAFKVKTTNPKRYCVRPNNGVVLPSSTFDIIVTMQAQKKAPTDMQCKDKFLFQSVVASPGATTKDITPEMFKKESGYEVEECKLRVVYVAPPKPQSPVQEGSDEKLSPQASLSSDEARALISKLTEERNFVIEQNKRLQQELNLLRSEANGDSHIM